jgi:hypothetical protein
VEVVPSENAHDQDVGTPVVVSVNWTVNGASPDDGNASKDAVGATCGIPAPVITVR